MEGLRKSRRNITLTGLEPILQTHALLPPGPILSNQRPKDFDSVESRRSKASQRRMTPARRFYLEPHRLAVQEAVMSLMRESEQVLKEVCV